MKKVLLGLIMAIAFCGTPAMAVELTGSAAPNVGISSFGWGAGTPGSSTITIPAGITSLADIQIGVRVSGSNATRWSVPEIISPQGTRITLYYPGGGACGSIGLANPLHVTFGQSYNAAFNGSNLSSGYMTVMQTCTNVAGPMGLDALDGINPTGTWTLEVWDDDGVPGGLTFVEWNITVADTQIGVMPPPPNDFCTNSIDIDDFTTTSFDMSSATASGVDDCTATAAEDIWYRLIPICAGTYTFATATSSFATTVTVWDGSFGCPVNGVTPLDCGMGSGSASLVIGQTVYVQVSPQMGATPGTGEIIVTSDSAPANDQCDTPEIGPNVSMSIPFDTTCATEGFTQTCSAGPTSTWALHDVWYLFTADCDGALTLDTFGSSFDTAIAVWPMSSCPTGPAPICNDQAASPPPGENNRSEVTIAPVAIGEQYLVQIGGGVLGETGVGVLNVSWNCLPTEPDFRRGDANHDALFNIADPVATLSVLFVTGTPAPLCERALDANDDGLMNIADPVYSLTALFAQGPPPPAPGPSVCGQDPTMDSLTCDSSPMCP